MDRTIRLIYMLFAVSTMAILYSCGGGAPDGEDDSSDMNNVDDETIEVDQSLNTTLDGKLFSIPSPIQMMDMIKNSGGNFDKTILNKPDNIANYISVTKKALNLGVYGSDLGYVTIYEKNDDALSYLKAVENLSDELGIAGAFDSELIERISENSGNQDSMLVLVTEAYRKGDNFLKENERTEISALILAGGWVESLFFASKLAQDQGSDDLKNRIAEQSVSLTTLIDLLSKYEEKDEIYKVLIEHFKELKTIYQGINSDYSFVKPATDPEKKLTIIQSTSSVSIDSETLTKILDKITEIRNEIIS